MTSSRKFEDRLQSTGMVLRERPSVVDQIMAEIRRTMMERAAVSKPEKQPGPQPCPSSGS